MDHQTKQGLALRVISRGICQRCGGSGQLLRPSKTKLLTFCRCGACRGHGVRWKYVLTQTDET